MEADDSGRVMNERVKQEESEGKTHDQPGVSPVPSSLSPQRLTMAFCLLEDFRDYAEAQQAVCLASRHQCSYCKLISTGHPQHHR